MSKTRRTRSPAVLALLLWSWLALLPNHVAADAKDEARILFEAGVAASRSERWREASEYFQRSLSLSEKPSTWFNLAVAEVKLGNGQDALRALDAFEQMGTRADHAEMLDRAVSLRAQARVLVRQDTDKPVQTPVPEPVPQSPGFAREQTPDATTAPATRFAEPLPVAQPVPPPVQPARYESKRGGPGALIALGAASAVGAVGSVVWWRNRVDAHDRCTEDLARCTNASQLSREQRTAGAVSLALGVLSAGLIAGGTTWLVRENRRARRPEAALQLGRHQAGFTLKLAF